MYTKGRIHKGVEPTNIFFLSRFVMKILLYLYLGLYGLVSILNISSQLDGRGK